MGKKNQYPVQKFYGLPLARFLTSQAPAALLKQGQALLGAKQ